MSLPIYLGSTWMDESYWPPYDNFDRKLQDYYLGTSGEGFKMEEVCWDETHPGPPYRTGGPLHLFKITSDQYIPKAPVVVIRSNVKFVGHHGPKYDLPRWHSWPNLSAFEAAGVLNLNDLGARAWNKFKPTNSGTDLGQFLGEIKEVPRMFQQTARGFRDIWKSSGGNRGSFGPKSVADHWLNTQFGWFPFVSELRSFYNLTSNLDKRIKQLRRDNGNWIRRGGVLYDHQADQELLYEQNSSAGLKPAVNLQWQTPYGSVKMTRDLRHKVWFKGTFRYWIPGKTDSWEWKARALSLLYGARPSPSLVWELTPWSWLVDWCSNVGDVISNMDSRLYDNLAAKYAFLMGHVEETITYTGMNNYHTGPITCSWTSKLDSKQRTQAHPFGFSLSNPSFSVRQWSILAALGISKTWKSKNL